MKPKIETEEQMIENEKKHTKLHTLLHTKQHSYYSLFQHFLLAIWPLAFFIYQGFREDFYWFFTPILFRLTVILYLLIIIVVYLITKKRDVLYMIIVCTLEFPLFVFLAYYDQMITLATLAVLGGLVYIRESLKTQAKRAMDLKLAKTQSKHEKQHHLD